MGFVYFIFLAIGLWPSLVLSKQVEWPMVREVEESTYELALAKFYYHRENANLQNAKAKGYAKDVFYYDALSQQRKKIYDAKIKIHSNFSAAVKALKKINTNQIIHELREYLPLTQMSLLRWKTLENIFSKESVLGLVQSVYNISEIENEAFPVIETRSPQNPKLMLLFIGEKIHDIDFNELETKVFTPSNFTNLSEKADELRNFLTSSELGNKDLILVSQGEYSSIVYSMLDQYTLFHSSKKIKSWISVNGNFYEKRAVPQSLPNRSLASIESNYPESWTKIQLPLATTFPIYSILDRSIHESSFPVTMVLHESKNYYCKNEKNNFWLSKLVRKISSTL